MSAPKVIQQRRRQFAQFAGTTAKQVYRDEKRGAPITSPEAYKLWRESSLRIHRDPPPQETAGDTTNIGRQTARLRCAQAQLAEQKAAQERGELVTLEAVLQVVLAAGVVFATQLDALPGRMANELAACNDPALVRAKLRDECRRIREAAGGEFDRIAAEVAEQRDSTAPEPDTGRVGEPDAHSPAGLSGAGAVPQ